MEQAVEQSAVAECVELTGAHGVASGYVPQWSEVDALPDADTDALRRFLAYIQSDDDRIYPMFIHDWRVLERHLKEVLDIPYPFLDHNLVCMGCDEQWYRHDIEFQGTEFNMGGYHEKGCKYDESQIEKARFNHGVSFNPLDLVRVEHCGTTMKYVGLQSIRVRVIREFGEVEERDMHTDDTIECWPNDSIEVL